MSFEKMNHFVAEHTVLMREFLRNISSAETCPLTEQNNCESGTTMSKQFLNKTILPIVTLTPQTPNMSKGLRNNLPNFVLANNVETKSAKNEASYEMELIDLGKQLSILHSLLNSIISALDKVCLFLKHNPL